ncbi:MAG: hypothetical protein HRU26_06450, partial [Psychroserpens sp.]|nr:hypothetical protein [Psychroserpens sp.]
MKSGQFLTLILSCCLSLVVFGQNAIDLKAEFDVENKTVQVKQTIKYFNSSEDTLNEIYLNDWNNAYSTKNTPLAKRFEE